MELTRSLLERLSEEYQAEEPLATVEDEHREMLPDAFASGEYGWRDAEWVVQWYYRRHLGAYPARERRDAEDAFRENESDDVRDAIAAIQEMDSDDPTSMLDRLTDLEGVDVPMASAFLHFAYPDRFVVIGEREWRALVDAGELDEQYPGPPSVDDYRRYHAVCTRLMDEFDVDARTLSQALWRLGADDPGGTSTR